MEEGGRPWSAAGYRWGVQVSGCACVCVYVGVRARARAGARQGPALGLRHCGCSGPRPAGGAGAPRKWMPGVRGPREGLSLKLPLCGVPVTAQ